MKFRLCVNGTLTMYPAAEVDWAVTEKANAAPTPVPTPILAPTPTPQVPSGIANKMQVRNAEGLVKQNENSGKLKTASGKEIAFEGRNFFGKESVAEYLELGTFLADTSTCPTSRAVTYGVVKSISRLKRPTGPRISRPPGGTWESSRRCQSPRPPGRLAPSTSSWPSPTSRSPREGVCERNRLLRHGNGPTRHELSRRQAHRLPAGSPRRLEEAHRRAHHRPRRGARPRAPAGLRRSAGPVRLLREGCPAEDGRPRLRSGVARGSVPRDEPDAGNRELGPAPPVR